MKNHVFENRINKLIKIIENLLGFFMWIENFKMDTLKNLLDFLNINKISQFLGSPQNFKFLWLSRCMCNYFYNDRNAAVSNLIEDVET